MRKKPIIAERVEQSCARIDKLEEIINNLGSNFSCIRTIERTPTNNLFMFMDVPKIRVPHLVRRKKI